MRRSLSGAAAATQSGKNGSPTSADQRATTYTIDALTGELLWKRLVDDYLGATTTASPTLADGTLYVATSSFEEVIGANPKYECCKFRGSIFAT